MPPAGSCLVCLHPEKALIETALRTGVPGVRATARQFQLVDHNVLSRHRKRCMGIVAPKPEEVARIKIAAVTPLQLERASLALGRAHAELALERAVVAQELAEALARRAVGTEDYPGDPEIAAKTVNALVAANGGGVRQAAETVGKFSGELQTGGATNIQVNVDQASRDRDFGERLQEVLPELLRQLAPYVASRLGVDDDAASDSLSAALDEYLAEQAADEAGAVVESVRQLPMGGEGDER